MHKLCMLVKRLQIGIEETDLIGGAPCRASVAYGGGSGSSDFTSMVSATCLVLLLVPVDSQTPHAATFIDLELCHVSIVDTSHIC